MIGFNNIPSTYLSPAFLVEFDGSRAVGGGALAYSVAIIGEHETLSQESKSLTKLADAESFFGKASNGLKMYEAFKANSSNVSVLGITIKKPTSANPSDIEQPETLAKTIGKLADRADFIVVDDAFTAVAIAKAAEVVAKRWEPAAALDGILVFCGGGTTTIDSEYVVQMNSNGSKSPGCVIAAAVTGVVAEAAQIDPARPFQTLPVFGIEAPAKQSMLERNEQLDKRVSTLRVSNRVTIDRIITTASNAVYRDLNTMLTLAYLRWDFARYMTMKFPRHKVAKDGYQVPQGQPIVTPKTLKGEAISCFKRWQDQGLVQNIEGFKSGLVVEISPINPNQVNFLLPADLIRQWIIGAAQISFA